MPQKIKILKLTKPYEYVKRELDILKGQKVKLLSSADWTQVIDCGLSTKTMLEWRYWRNKVRQVDTADYLKLESTREFLNDLDQNRPISIKREDEFFSFILNDFNYSSLENFKKSCIMMLAEHRPASILANKKIIKAKTYGDAFGHFIKEF